MNKEAAARRVILGTRGSELALFQAHHVAWTLQKHNVDLSVKIQKITTSGDKVLDSPLAEIGDKGLFVKEIETALLSGDIDLAVHSSKDLPTELPEGLMIGALGAREDPRDAFLGQAGGLADLPEGARIGTSSLRRRSQLLALRPDLEIVDIRGNVDTRIRKIAELGLDGTILAAAGVKRLERESEVSFYFSVEEMIPAVGQGVIAIEVREGDGATRDLVTVHDDAASTAAVQAERALMRWLEGGCQVPIGAHATVSGDKLILRAYLGSLDGKRFIRDSIEGPVILAENLGEQLGKKMFESGGEEILNEVREAPAGENTGYWT